jgi:hypothetical protein
VTKIFFLFDYFCKFIQGESINFDPSLAKACQNDIHKFCGNQNPGNAQVIFIIIIFIR